MCSSVETVPVEGEGPPWARAARSLGMGQGKRPPATLEEVVRPFVVLDEKREEKSPYPNTSRRIRFQKRLFHSLSERIRTVRLRSIRPPPETGNLS